LNYVFKNFSFLRSEKLFPNSESEMVQSLTWVQSLSATDKSKRTEKERTQAIIQVPSSHVPLALPRRVPLKCNIGLQIAQSHKKETSQCSRTTPRDFYAQSHKKETSLLKDNSKRLPLLNYNWKRLLCSRTTPRDFLCSITTERDFYAQGQLQESSFAQSQLKETSLNNYK